MLFSLNIATAQKMNFFSECYQICMFPFNTPWQHQKTERFLMFSGGIKREHTGLVTFAEEILNCKHHFLCSVPCTVKPSAFVQCLKNREISGLILIRR